jgi:hypothetical protein
MPRQEEQLVANIRWRLLVETIHMRRKLLPLRTGDSRMAIILEIEQSEAGLRSDLGTWAVTRKFAVVGEESWYLLELEFADDRWCLFRHHRNREKNDEIDYQRCMWKDEALTEAKLTRMVRWMGSRRGR